MSIRIRLARGGAKKRPFYRVVVADSRSPRDGKFIEKLGTYNPVLPNEGGQRLNLDKDRVSYWLSKGAKPSERVATFLVAEGLYKRTKAEQKVLDARIKVSEAAKAEKLKQEQEAAKKAEEEAAAATKAEAEAKAQEEAEAKANEEAATEAPAEEKPAE